MLVDSRLAETKKWGKCIALLLGAAVLQVPNEVEVQGDTWRIIPVSKWLL